MPSALAVCRLKTNSNLAGCTTGRSAALTPLRTLRDADLTIHVRDIGSVAHQPVGCDVIPLAKKRWNPLAHRRGGKLHATAAEECVGSDEEGVGPVPRKLTLSSSSCVSRSTSRIFLIGQPLTWIRCRVIRH
jgi:hypothetical protein